MITLYILLFNITILFSQNFIYQQEDWLVISNPGSISCMTNKSNELIFTSDNGIFIYDTDNSLLSNMPQFIRGFNSKYNVLIHYDRFRDHIWFMDNERIYFKSFISTIWREIDFYELGISNYYNIKNIGSDFNYIYLKDGNDLIVLDPYIGKIINEEEIDYVDLDAIIWSSSIYDKNPKSINLDQFYSIDNYKIISDDFIQYNNVYININCIMKGDENKIWIGTESGFD